MDEKTFWQKCRDIFAVYIRSNMLDAAIIAGANAVFLAAMGLPYVFPISIIAGIANTIPTVGPVIGAAAGALLLVFHKPVSALWFLLFTVLLQLLDSYLIRPKLFGSSLGVPSFVVLIATLLGGWIFGIWGILLAVPAAAILLMAIRGRTRPDSGADAAQQEQPPQDAPREE